ncbi:fructose-bisphosphatase class III, partial [Staphylococcus epidermidis]|uniref:fructose-bisphosphatase class III n=1 Tax=Staphylococcus epidermidis TaxID=1282 RepID=UPI00119F9601
MTHITQTQIKQKYLHLLSQKFHTPQKLPTQIINLHSILQLPKPTQHFLTDLHPQYQSF